MLNPTNEDLARFDPASRLVALVDRVQPRYRRDGLAGLNEAERTLLALFVFDNEICNGGFGQWLYQTPLDLIAVTPECLERIGEVRYLEVVRALLDDLGPAALRLDQQSWEVHVQQMPEAFWQRIGAYDREVGPLERGMVEKVWTYAKGVVTQVRPGGGNRLTRSERQE